MSASTLLARGRWAAEQLMVDACIIQRPVAKATNPINGVVTPSYSVIYTGKCQVGTSSPAGQDVAENHAATLSPIVAVPASVTGVIEGDVVTITASRHDPEKVGKVLRVTGPMHQTYGTARRLSCVEVSA